MKQVPYSSPVPISSYPFLATVFLGAGFSVMAGYFVYQMKSGHKFIIIELIIGLIASIALGFGTLFAMLSFGLYV